MKDIYIAIESDSQSISQSVNWEGSLNDRREGEQPIPKHGRMCNGCAD